MKLKLKIMYSLVLTFIVFIMIAAQENSTSSTVDNLNWLSGHWKSHENGILMEEYWLPVSNNTMFGIHRDSFQSGKVFFEYLSIYQKSDSIIYEARPMGKKSTKFKLKILHNKTVTFENPGHDYPQRIIYSLSSDTLMSRIEGIVNGQQKFSEWKWIKTKLVHDEIKEEF